MPFAYQPCLSSKLQLALWPYYCSICTAGVARCQIPYAYRLHCAAALESQLTKINRNILCLVQARVLLWGLSIGWQNWVDGTILGHFKAIDSFAGKILDIIFTAAEQDSTVSTSGFQGLMAVACADGSLLIMDMADYTVIYSLRVSECADIMHQPCSSNRGQVGHNILAAFSVCNTWLATVGLSSCSNIQIWEAETGAPIGSCISSVNTVKAIKWALDTKSRHTLVIGDVAGGCSFHLWECGSVGPETDRARLSSTLVA